ncbi:MAG: membrane protein insertase YidC, partial [Candidatus Obscuribacterales bacterium]
ITYQLMIPALQKLVEFTHSYGLSIILLTVAVRIIVWPLVSASTKSMQKMQLLQPRMKLIQERYKGDPEMLQKKVMEFYAKNKANPLGGCLPMLVQLPILFALFGTFNGPPFGDKPIDVKVTVVEAKDASKVHRAETSGNNSPYVSPEGVLSKVIVFPGESTVLVGDSIDFGTRATEGKLPEDFKPLWVMKFGGNFATPTQGVIDQTGHAVFAVPGEFHVEGVVHGIAKRDSFLFINSLGKTATGLDLLKPQNYDLVFLIIAFGASMFLSSKLTMAKQNPEDMDESQRVTQDTMKYMPIAMSVSFFFIPLPTGVYLYMVVSNLFQTAQTWLVMRTPPEPLIDPDGFDSSAVPASPISPKSGPGNVPNSGKKEPPRTIDVTPSEPKNGSSKDEGGTIKFGQADKVGETIDAGKSKKKKKKQ